MDNARRENKEKEALIVAINHFSVKYPNHKFITEGSVKKICQKYGLVYGEISRYKGEVPDKNLKAIEDFKIDEYDECYVEYRTSSWDNFRVVEKYKAKEKPIQVNNPNIPDDVWIEGGGSTAIDMQKNWVERETQRAYRSFQEQIRQEVMSYHFGRGRTKTEKCPLEIAAPVKDFDMTGMQVKDSKISKIEIPDPVVLQPVVYNNQKYYLIVTAWGLEASDELVVNQKMN